MPDPKPPPTIEQRLSRLVALSRGDLTASEEHRRLCADQILDYYTVGDLAMDLRSKSKVTYECAFRWVVDELAYMDQTVEQVRAAIEGAADAKP